MIAVSTIMRPAASDVSRMRRMAFACCEILGIDEYAPLDEVNRAYKRLSLVGTLVPFAFDSFGSRISP